jgi:hypothetical protein
MSLYIRFGGFTPLIAASLVAAAGNMYAGLAYPIVVAVMTFILGTRLIPETNHINIWNEMGGAATVAEPATAPAK